MSKKLGYSIRYQGDEMVAVGVSRLEKARWRVENLEQCKADDGPSDALAKAMMKSKSNFTIAVPCEDVRSALMSLPQLKKKQMDLAAKAWVAREESTGLDEWNVAWSLRERPESQPETDKADVFLLYTSKEFVEKEMQKLASWNGAPSRMVPSFRTLESMYRHYGPEKDELEGWNVVFVGKEDHFLCVSTPSGMIMNRSLPADLSEDFDMDEYLSRLATEVDRSIFFARQTEFNPNVQKIIVCGEPDLAQGLVARLKEETSVPALFWDVAEMFEYDGGKLDSNLLLPVMAAVMARKKSKVNLLPDQPLALLSPVLRRRLVLAGTTVAAVGIPILVVGGFLTSNIQDHYLEKAHLKLEEAQVRADEAAEVYITQRVLQAREEHINNLHKNDQDYAQVLLHLASLTPGEIVFKDLRLKEKGDGQLVLLLTGESISGTVEVAQQSFLDFQKALNSSEMLQTTGEPRKLVIAAKNDKGIKVKKVEFSMEYRVNSAQTTQNEVATVVTRTEG